MAEQLSQKASHALDATAIVSNRGFAAVPTLPKTLGMAGVIPFLALSPPIVAGLPWMPADLVANAAALQIGYGVTVCSFLGGIHWGLAMANYGKASLAVNSDRYLWSVAPCLMAWPALVMPPGPGSLVTAGSLGVVYMVDKSFAKRSFLPSWYMSLRLPLTLAAVGGLTVTCISSLLSEVPPRVPDVETEQQTEHKD